MFELILAPTLTLLILRFPLLSHPLSIGVTLLLVTLTISLIVGVFHSSIWVSYATILILLGGVLVIFIYVALLASNEIFKKNKLASFPFLFSLFLILNLFFTNPFIREFSCDTINTIFIRTNARNLNWLSDFYSSKLRNLTLFLIFYLLLTLLAVVFNTKNNHGTLRSSS